jgi:hypothetical protein
VCWSFGGFVVIAFFLSIVLPVVLQAVGGNAKQEEGYRDLSSTSGGY